MTALFYRGSNLVAFRELKDYQANELMYARTPEPFFSAMPFTLEPGSIMVEWREVFKKTNFLCPLCHCVVYNSQNYMERPQWVIEKEGELGPKISF